MVLRKEDTQGGIAIKKLLVILLALIVLVFLVLLITGQLFPLLEKIATWFTQVFIMMGLIEEPTSGIVACKTNFLHNVPRADELLKEQLDMDSEQWATATFRYCGDVCEVDVKDKDLGVFRISTDTEYPWSARRGVDRRDEAENWDLASESPIDDEFYGLMFSEIPVEGISKGKIDYQGYLNTRRIFEPVIKVDVFDKQQGDSWQDYYWMKVSQDDARFYQELYHNFFYSTLSSSERSMVKDFYDDHFTKRLIFYADPEKGVNEASILIWQSGYWDYVWVGGGDSTPRGYNWRDPRWIARGIDHESDNNKALDAFYKTVHNKVFPLEEDDEIVWWKGPVWLPEEDESGAGGTGGAKSIASLIGDDQLDEDDELNKLLKPEVCKIQKELSEEVAKKVSGKPTEDFHDVVVGKTVQATQGGTTRTFRVEATYDYATGSLADPTKSLASSAYYPSIAIYNNLIDNSSLSELEKRNPVSWSDIELEYADSDNDGLSDMWFWTSDSLEGGWGSQDDLENTARRAKQIEAYGAYFPNRTVWAIKKLEEMDYFRGRDFILDNLGYSKLLVDVGETVVSSAGTLPGWSSSEGCTINNVFNPLAIILVDEDNGEMYGFRFSTKARASIDFENLPDIALDHMPVELVKWSRESGQWIALADQRTYKLSDDGLEHFEKVDHIRDFLFEICRE